MKNYKYFAVITGFFVATLLVTNTIESKIFLLWDLALPAGIIIFPLAYLFGDILTEVYGYAYSRKVIWTGFIAQIFMILTYKAAELLPAAPFWTNQDAFQLILGSVPRIALASMIAYFVGEFCNSYILAKMKVRTDGKGIATRFVASTIAGEGIDTIVFVLIAFTGIMSRSEMLQVILSAWGVKVVWEIIALPITIRIVKWLKKVENEDYYDNNTNFSPFKV
ncbi:MAG: hypothetical protein JWN37_229 [Candidatus Nomurabacteria bacterium]|nr:hypothetical protein [Candidatus Nomurabacteria bacterium]